MMSDLGATCSVYPRISCESHADCTTASYRDTNDLESVAAYETLFQEKPISGYFFASTCLMNLLPLTRALVPSFFSPVDGR